MLCANTYPVVRRFPDHVTGAVAIV
jgi:hypothetical protein